MSLLDRKNLAFDPDSHTYRLNETIIPGVTSILSRAGMVKLPPMSDPNVVRKRRIGKEVHRACQILDLLGRIDHCSLNDPEVVGTIDAYEYFLSQSRPTWELVECGVLIQKYGLTAAGTLDRAGILFGEPFIVDFKTGSPSPSHGVQMAGYELGLHPPKIYPFYWRRAALHLRKNGSFKLIEYTDRSDSDVFLAALQDPDHNAVRIWKMNHRIETEEEYEG